MKTIVGGFFFIIIGITTALPITNVPSTDRNLVILGALALLTFGAVLTGCVCCRRKQKGFENHLKDPKEFINESTSLECNKNEFPIFGALSTDIDKCTPDEAKLGGGDGGDLNASNENLIADDADNNNGPISPADLENIENNNAINYIENQNEQRHVEIFIGEEDVQCDERPVLYGSTSETTAIIPQISVSSTFSPPVSQKFVVEREVFENVIVPENVPIFEAKKNVTAVTNTAAAVAPFENECVDVKDVELFFIPEIVVQMENEVIECDKKDKIETSSLKSTSSNSSDKSNEVNSVEEALRALDIAIENEDTDGEGNEQDIESDRSSDEEVVPFIGDETHTLCKTESQDGEIAKVEEQAKLMVEEILETSQRIIEEKLAEIPNKTDFTDPQMHNANNSFEDFEDMDLLAKSSTPCIQTKFSSTSSSSKTRPSKAQQPLFLTGTIIEEKSLNNPFVSQYEDDDDDPKPLPADATFDAAPVPTNVTIVVDAVNQTYDANGTFDLNNKTFPVDYTYPGDPCTSKQALERDVKCQRKSQDEIVSEDLNTITPVNTPIEMNYNKETWDKITDQQRMEDNGWFLHPQAVEEFGNDDDENNEDNLELTFDMLRKQLAEVLPQGGVSGGNLPTNDFCDEDEDGCNRTYDEYRNPLMDALLEIDNEPVQNDQMIINYKRSLSPIMEESEEDITCKTFAINETRVVDNNSTSTGCVETSEAIMGVSKNLMASNDTLFNFEDTLGDKDDSSLISRSQNDSEANTPVKSGKSPLASSNNSQATSIATVTTSSSETERVYCSPFEDETETDDKMMNKRQKLSLEFTNEVFENDDICSPSDQQKTFSEECTSSDRLSSDLSPTLDNDATNTNDACITVIVKDDDDEKISEVSEPEWGSTATGTISVFGTGVFIEDHDLNSLADVQSMDLNHHGVFENPSDHEDSGHSTQDNTHTTTDDYELELNQRTSDSEESEELKENEDPNVKKVNTTANSLIKENNQKVQKCLDSVITKKTTCVNNMATINHIEEEDGDDDSQNATSTFLPDKENLACAESLKSGFIKENDLKTTSFVNKSDDDLDNWDGDDYEESGEEDEGDEDDEDNSSEEFMYVSKDQIETYNKAKSEWEEEKLGEQVQICDSEDSESVSSSSEGEFVPSSWNSLAMPSRSALKSPDKSSSEKKKRRNVVFKKQRYFSVYEYPKEHIDASPTHSEPKLDWNVASNKSNYFDIDRIGYQELREEFNDGFTVSSTARPFHGSQFNAMCHTWPTDADFSWSQVEDDEVHYSNSISDIKWDIKNEKKSDKNTDTESKRPDSGVGESAEMLLDRQTVGELCHTKSSLRLPIEGFSTTISPETTHLECRLFPEAVVLPTPSCTGSMDSLNSSSSSERQITNFTTFKAKIEDNDDSMGAKGSSVSSSSLNSSFSGNGKPQLILFEEDILDTKNLLTAESITDKIKQSDSTDEDSGIEFGNKNLTLH
ncbi:hypothetical protein ACFFRR_007499 [Megaselia abdita]